jgi:hypothetical protein
MLVQGPSADGYQLTRHDDVGDAIGYWGSVPPKVARHSPSHPVRVRHQDLRCGRQASFRDQRRPGAQEGVPPSPAGRPVQHLSRGPRASRRRAAIAAGADGLLLELSDEHSANGLSAGFGFSELGRLVTDLCAIAAAVGRQLCEKDDRYGQNGAPVA